MRRASQLMRRLVHDLSGCAQRLSRLSEQLGEDVDQTAEVWRDARGQAFLREHLLPCRPNVAQLVSGLQETVDLLDEIVRKLSDPDFAR